MPQSSISTISVNTSTTSILDVQPHSFREFLSILLPIYIHKTNSESDDALATSRDQRIVIKTALLFKIPYVDVNIGFVNNI